MVDMNQEMESTSAAHANSSDEGGMAVNTKVIGIQTDMSRYIQNLNIQK